MQSLSDLDVAREAARLGARVAAEYLNTDLQVRSKSGPGDVVSVADEHAERAVIDFLAAQRPDDGVIGEEGGRRSGARTWLVDAVDGTLNFVRGDTFWCSAVAVQDGDGPLAAAVHRSAAAETYSAARGQGCWLNGTRLHMGQGPRLGAASVSTYLGPGDAAQPEFQRVAHATASLRIRGAGSIELAWVAAGRVDAWIQRDMQLWDQLPGSLLIAEAGGATGTHQHGAHAWFLAGGSQTYADLLDQLGTQGA